MPVKTANHHEKDFFKNCFFSLRKANVERMWEEKLSYESDWQIFNSSAVRNLTNPHRWKVYSEENYNSLSILNSDPFYCEIISGRFLR